MRILSTFVALMVIAVRGFAGGTLSGRITDAKSNESLIGVTIVVKNTAAGAVSDVEGRYAVVLAPGTYEVEFKYVGYTAKSIGDVVIREGEVTSLNVIMEESGKTQQLQEVVVRGSLKKESINALYTIQKNNVSVSSGISADVIARTPDRSTGEVLKRVSGTSVQNNKYVVVRGLSERYNIAMINNALMPSTEPDRKAFSFDVIPSNLIDNIIINKTASADLPGDFAGGVIQVLTKDVPDQNFLNVGIGLGYNSQTTFKEFKHNERSTGDYFGFPDNGKSELPKSFGKDYQYYKALSTNQRTELARQLNNNFPFETSSAMPNTNLQVSIGNVRKFKGNSKLGIVGSFNLRNSQTLVPEFTRGLYERTTTVNRIFTDKQYRFNSNLSGLLNISYVKGKSKLSFKNLYNKFYDNMFYERDGYITSSNQQVKMFSTVPSDKGMYNTQLEGEHAFGKKNYKLNWNVNYSNVRFKQHDLRTAFYSRYATFDANGLNPQVNEGEHFELNDRNSRRMFFDQTDHNYGGNVNFIAPFEIGGKKQSLKAGYLGLYKTRDFQGRLFQHRPGSSFVQENGEKPVNTVFAPENYGPTGFELEEISNSNDLYEANSLLNAGYVMFDNSFGSKWRLTWGVRLENYTQKLITRTVSLDRLTKKDVFTDILPSLNLSYDFTEKSKLRFSASRTVNRPEFREIAPFDFTDFENLWQIGGNASLKRANITNLDLRYEIYPSPGEAITVGAFYKNFENPIEAYMRTNTNLDLFQVSYTNAKSATSIGGEVEVRKNLSFIGDARWLQNITAAANVTYIHSTVDLDGFASSEDRPMQGQSPYLINLSLLYSEPNSGFGFSALYNRIGQRIAIVGNAEIPNTWENGRDVIDLQLSKQILKRRGEIKLTVSDLLNQNYVLYWNTSGGKTFKKGADVLGRNNDQVYQKYKLGTTFNIGFTYRFDYK